MGSRKVIAGGEFFVFLASKKLVVFLIIKTKQMTKQMACTLCGYVGEVKQKARGNGLVEFLLWWFFIIPGLLYSIWSRGGKKKSVCPKCGNENLIPQDTPLGQKLMAEQQNNPNISKTSLVPEKTSNKTRNVMFGVVIAVFVFLMIAISISVDDAKKREVTENANVPQALQENNSGQQTAPSVSVKFKELKSYAKSGKTWRNIVIPSGTSQKDLIALAKELHAKDAKSSFHIFDDDAKFQEYMDWDINYGRIKDTDGKIKQIDQCLDVDYCRTLIQQEKYAFPFPEAWDKKHNIGMINQMFDTTSGKLEWKLMDSLGTGLSNL